MYRVNIQTYDHGVELAGTVCPGDSQANYQNRGVLMDESEKLTILGTMYWTAPQPCRGDCYGNNKDHQSLDVLTDHGKGWSHHCRTAPSLNHVVFPTPP
ncbi:uncharacterized protein EHS24_002261 [Apiotrichum porosum]|uniref:Uncharacterized protein n=1 Tax=Apiotrichum porosum TaxID=105984 RepID=A0A427XI75_9TREE|nr:uncharacterized protein EHS24_002261 [Apiotrichum porosum]RSH78536.1 hypothetical protein EHS24_002261 [Apiotrichum porosum]